MKTLKLRKEIFHKLISGEKISTSRQGVRDYSVGEEIKFVMTEDESVECNVIITKVTYCKFKDLTLEEALKEGYSTLEDLKLVLNKIYNPKDTDDFTFIEYKLI